jgi:hypothetical protein
MVGYTNETKVKDIPYPNFENEIKELFKSAVFDFGAEVKKEVFDHSVKRLAGIIYGRYKGYMLGEVKYVFEAMVEHIKGKLSVSSIMQLFYKYNEEKIEKQRRESEERDISIEKNFVNCFDNPLGSAIIHKMQMVESGQLKIENWDTVNLKQLAEDIKTGKVIHHYKPERKNRKKWQV